MSAPLKDFPQVLKESYDPALERIRVDALISDGIDTLIINPDGSINVNVINTTPENSGTEKSFYNSISSVATGVLTTLATYTVPVSVDSYLKRIDVSGTNIATYEVTLNAVVIARRRTYFGGNLNDCFDFSPGIKYVTGDVITVSVIHNRPDLGDFDGRIQVNEK